MTINNQWSSRYTVVEVTGLDRPGLLYELTATLSKLNLNIASAHVATFGERVVDVFYVTDLLGAQISEPTRQTAIKRPLIARVRRAERRGEAGERGRRGVTLSPPPCGEGQGWGSRGFAQASTPRSNLPTPTLPSPTRGEGSRRVTAP